VIGPTRPSVESALRVDATTDLRIGFQRSFAALEQDRHGVRGHLDLAQLLERVLELGRDEERGDRDVLVRELLQREVEVEAMVEDLRRGDGAPRALASAP